MQKIMEAAKKQIDGLLEEKDMVIMAIDGMHLRQDHLGFYIGRDL